jgi:metal-responsive CopG/Arc/MetJ family transcriptional regulator
MIEAEILDRLHSISARTGLSKSEQIRQGIQWWLESREWPGHGERSASARLAVNRSSSRTVHRSRKRRS